MERWRELQASDIRLDSPFLSPQWARAVERAGETEIRRVEGDVAMAWYPASYPHLRASPAGRAWVAWDAYHVCLMALRYG